jgi:hypothetical protein
MKIMAGVTEPDITSGSCDIVISFFDMPDADFQGSRPIRDVVLISFFNQILSDFSTNGQILQFLSINLPDTIITDPLAGSCGCISGHDSIGLTDFFTHGADCDFHDFLLMR